MTEKIAILIDSCSDAPQYLQDKEYVKTMPMQLHWDGEVLRDRVDITPDEFYDRMKHSSTIPTTSSPQSGDIIEKFEELKKRRFYACDRYLYFEWSVSDFQPSQFPCC